MVYKILKNRLCIELREGVVILNISKLEKSTLTESTSHHWAPERVKKTSKIIYFKFWRWFISTMHFLCKLCHTDLRSKKIYLSNLKVVEKSTSHRTILHIKAEVQWMSELLHVQWLFELTTPKLWWGTVRWQVERLTRFHMLQWSHCLMKPRQKGVEPVIKKWQLYRTW